MIIKGKSTGLAGSIVSLAFSSIGYILAKGFSSISKTKDFIDSYLDSFTSQGYSRDYALDALELYREFAKFIEYGSLVFLILGIIALILIIKLKTSNVKTVGALILVISILHIFCFRILSFILLLISSIKLLKYMPDDIQNEPISVSE